VAKRLHPQRTDDSVPSGAPAWITGELIARTIEVWQPYYSEPLSADDAMLMLINVGQVLRTVSNEPPWADQSSSC
jgi:hypothetical protein